MEYEENFILAINFVNLLNTQRDEGTKKNKIEFREIRLQFFPMNSDGWISFILSQNAYHALILRSFINNI